jgi:hypothetical protein
MVWGFFGTDEPAEAENTPTPKHKTVQDDADKTVEEAFECDYERDCTPLYKAIETAMSPEEFEPIVKFLDTGYWPGSFFADAILPADQAKTWVTRFDPVDANKVKWSQLPLHLAIVCGAPASIIGRLVKLYPQALRCTDDQHMLPLHLALRHNSDDEIVAYLLMQFPDAVNAKGKNGRTAIDCALRAKDKLRGKIIEIFVEKTKGKRSATAAKEHNVLKLELKKKQDELEELKTDLAAMATNFENMKELKSTVENDLLLKIQELEATKVEFEADATEKIERLQSEKLLESLELQKKLDALMRSNAELEQKEREAREVEAKLVGELEAVHCHVNKSSASPTDIEGLKHQIQQMQSYRLQHTRSDTRNRIEELKRQLDESHKATLDTPTAANTMQKIKKLEKTEETAKTSEELTMLRNEVEMLRAELKDKAEASKSKVELEVLKKTMEMELENSDGKSESEITALRMALAKINNADFDKKSSQEIVSLKQEIEGMKKEMKEKELLMKTKKDLEDLRENVEAGMQDPKKKAELQPLRKTIDRMQNYLEKSNSNDELISLKKDVEFLKNELKKKDIMSKIMQEAAALKDTIDVELLKTEGRTQQELQQMKKLIKNINEKELSKKSIDELYKIKSELNHLKRELKELETATQTQQDLESLKSTLAEEIKRANGKTEMDLVEMKRAVDEIHLEKKEGQKLKSSLAEEIKIANKKTEEELRMLKKQLDAINVKEIEGKNKSQWDAIRKEMEAMKAELKQKQEEANLEEELTSVKKAMRDLNLDKIESQNKSEFKSLREEMEAMRLQMIKKADEEAELKKKLDELKSVQSAQMKKKGFKKFFEKRFIRNSDSKSVSSAHSRGSVRTEGNSNNNNMENVDTIAPPSITAGKIGLVASSSSESSSTDGDDTTTASKKSTSLIETVASGDSSKQNSVRFAKTPGELQREQILKRVSNKTKSAEAMRKVKSMDPRMMSISPKQQLSSTLTMEKTKSKIAAIHEDAVELATTTSDEDNILAGSLASNNLVIH